MIGSLPYQIQPVYQVAGDEYGFFARIRDCLEGIETHRAQRRLRQLKRQLEVEAVEAEIARLVKPATPAPRAPLTVVPEPIGKTDEATVLIIQLRDHLGRMPQLREVQDRYPDLPKTTAHRALQRMA